MAEKPYKEIPKTPEEALDKLEPAQSDKLPFLVVPKGVKEVVEK